jgi:hypothetical protein
MTPASPLTTASTAVVAATAIEDAARIARAVSPGVAALTILRMMERIEDPHGASMLVGRSTGELRIA